MPSDRSSETQRRFSREPPAADTSPLFNLPLGAPSLPPLRSSSSLSTRRPSLMSSANIPAGRQARTRPSDRYSARSRGALETRTESMDDTLGRWDHGWYNGQNSREDVRRSVPAQHSRAQSQDNESAGHLRDDTNQLRALLDFTHTPAHPYAELSFTSPSLPPQEPIEESRRAKRRKLDSDRLAPGFQGFRYGKYGQVEPGQLTMELVSCDGGIFSDDGQKYAAENILRNDDTVYCTEGPRCNIVLRHQGATVFTLQELIIKAPRSNFTDPVQEGMVFISMTSDHLLTRTAQYAIQYSPPRSSSRRVEREMQPLAPIVSVRHNEDGSTMTTSQQRMRRFYEIGVQDRHNELRVAQIPSEFNASPPPFHVTTECSDDDAEDPAPRGEWGAPNRIGSLRFESDTQRLGSDSSDEAAADDFSYTGTDDRLRRHRQRSTSALAEAAEAAQVATQEAVRAVGGELMAPHARFFIEQNKTKCTIRFDPPVSGRFILLKMWNPTRDPRANIDIRAVVAKGFAGPRFFPSVELR
ncbi:Uu.00g081990.m01.CDS01 [Anthostomella pinea]|uniref:Uu.00g081990.m01.CDS01 n=1 Tax=Anthostomella pinea TaxID=933095 RepID=A0AAI8VFW6_9PEZI|nr:Uu.00g081990.m01.CDS01 [Anthostomella pinea]